jgi:hypothetical protein
MDWKYSQKKFDPVTNETIEVEVSTSKLAEEKKAFLQQSNIRLRDICNKKIDTTMIGSLDAVEQEQ